MVHVTYSVLLSNISEGAEHENICSQKYVKTTFLGNLNFSSTDDQRVKVQIPWSFPAAASSCFCSSANLVSHAAELFSSQWWTLQPFPSLHFQILFIQLLRQRYVFSTVVQKNKKVIYPLEMSSRTSTLAFFAWAVGLPSSSMCEMNGTSVMGVRAVNSAINQSK